MPGHCTVMFSEVNNNIVGGLESIWHPVTQNPTKLFSKEIVTKCKTKEDKAELIKLLNETLNEASRDWNEKMEVCITLQGYSPQVVCGQLVVQHEVEAALQRIADTKGKQVQPLLLLTHCPVASLEIEKNRVLDMLKQEKERQEKLRTDLQALEEQRSRWLAVLKKVKEQSQKVSTSTINSSLTKPRPWKQQTPGRAPNLKCGTRRDE